MGFAIMGGLAIDSTNAWRHKTMLASTADVAALAGSMDLNPSEGPYSTGGYGDVESSALDFAFKNMNEGKFGSYMQNNDVYVGNWDHENRKFTWGENFSDPDELPVNAVRVHLGMNNENNNNVQTSLLRLAGMYEWDINTLATAYRSHDSCYLNGFMAESKVCVQSNNTFYPGFCIHGEEGLNFQNNNEWYDGVDVTSPETGSLNIANSNFDNGLEVRPLSREVPMVDRIPEIARGILLKNEQYGHMALPGPEDQAPGGLIIITDPNIGSNFSADLGDNRHWLDAPSNVQLAQLGGLSNIASLLALGAPAGGPPPYGCEQGGATGSYVEPYTGNMIADVVVDGGYGPTTGFLEENRVYYYPGLLGPADKLTIDGDLRNVVIVSEARIEIAQSSVLENVTLVSMYDGQGKHAVKVVSDVQLGRDDDCLPGGGVRIFAMGSVAGSASSQWNGSMVVSGGNIHFGAQAEAVRGVAAFAKGNVSFTSNNTFGSAAEAGVVDANGSCVGGVDLALPDDAYISVLVE